jgi:Suppressor of fused protein (SUFU)
VAVLTLLGRRPNARAMIYALSLTERATDTCARRLARWASLTLTLKEIVGILCIQVVPATTDRPYKTLVTTGMSEYAMTAPTDAVQGAASSGRTASEVSPEL